MSEGIPLFGSMADLPPDAQEGDMAAVVMTETPQGSPEQGGLLRAVLPPAIPPFVPDLDHAWMLLGQKEQYVLQLQSVMLERAKETNGIHDAVLAMTTRINILTDELTDARKSKGDLDAQIVEWQRIAQAAFESTEKELDVTRKERDDLRDELAVLKLHKETPSA